MATKRQPLLEAPELFGRQFAQAHADATDAWFRDLAAKALDNLDNVALLAVGGYGRRELCPQSDIDVVLVHGPEIDGGEVAEALWYPVWDRGLKMGYVVVTPDQAATLLEEEFEWATAFLDTRLICGSPKLLAEIDRMTEALWETKADDYLVHLAKTVANRHSKRGDVAFQIEPDLKQGRGGLRDAHALGWADRALPGFADDLLKELQPDIDNLLAARVELHRLANRPGDQLTFDYQDGVAEALGDLDAAGHPDAKALMLRLALSARRIAWWSDEAWRRWRQDRSAKQSITAGSPTVAIASPSLDTTLLEICDGLVRIRPGVEIADHPLLLLRMALLAAEAGLVIDRDDLALLAEHCAPIEEPWPPAARRLFEKLFLTGRPAIGVIEDLDQFGLMEHLIPEWSNVLCRPQRNSLHTFTVDRHLCEAAANASALVERVSRPDLLVVGALLHDIGKGFAGDHTEVGMKHIAEIGERMGYKPDDVAILVDLCRHHLLLPDVATRRDLSDPGTIRMVAAAVDSVPFLHLLAALTEADSKATGPATWGSWKAGLLRELVSRTEHVLNGGALIDVISDEFPNEEERAVMAAGERSIRGNNTTLTVIDPDRSGLFSTVAGVLAVCGLEVLDASAHSEEPEVILIPSGYTVSRAMAGCRFVLQQPQSGSVDWDHVIETTERALDGRLALQARVGRKSREQARYRRRLAAGPPRRDVVIDNDISDTATVVEVHAPDEIGLLYRLTQVLLELQLDLRTAKVQTLGAQAVDSFYIQTAGGSKVTDREVLSELRLALSEAIA